MRHFLRIFIGLSIVLLAMSVTAFSCNTDFLKKLNNPNTNTNDSGSGSGGGGGGTGGGTTIPKLELVAHNFYAMNGVKFSKIKDKTNVLISAKLLADALMPHPGRNDAERAFNQGGGGRDFVFTINYPGNKTTMIFVNRKDVTTNEIALGAAKPANNNCQDTGTETGDNTLAGEPGGGHCRVYDNGNSSIGVYSHLGTVFDNPNTTTHARAALRCSGWVRDNTQVITDPLRDTSVLNSISNFEKGCMINMVNNNLASTVTINDNWLDDTASVKEVELYAVGIDVEGKTIPQLLPAADNFTLTKFAGAIDNATFQKMLKHNGWADLRFKVKIVKAADY